MMSKTYYECHVTMLGDPKTLRAATQALGWTYSAIDNDANLGPGMKQYATRQLNSKVGLEAAIKQVTDVANSLRMLNAEVLREKVEEVLFDTRSSKVAACTDCAACQSSREPIDSEQAFHNV
jgi:hypothetical protein